MNRKKRKNEKNGAGWILFFSVIFLELLIYTWIRTESTHTILRISEAQKNLTRSMSYHTALVAERDRLNFTGRITMIGKTRLNLSTDITDRIIYMSEEED